MTRVEAMTQLGQTGRLVSAALWAVGALAAALEQKPHDWTDEDTARAVGLPVATVTQAKQVCLKFQTISHEPQFQLLFAHYQCVAGLPYGEAKPALDWAAENQANPAELRTFLRLQRGDDYVPE